MGDIRIVWDAATGTGDFVLAGGALELGSDLETAVLISLCTDQVASPDDILPPGQASDPRGWWADTYEGDQIGSKLWQAVWRQTTPDTLNWARDTASKALQWMVDDGVAAAIVVTPSFLGRGDLALGIVITESSGKRTPFTYLWALET
jgi:phage gp46-like protein